MLTRPYDLSVNFSSNRRTAGKTAAPAHRTRRPRHGLAVDRDPMPRRLHQFLNVKENSDADVGPFTLTNTSKADSTVTLLSSRVHNPKGQKPNDRATCERMVAAFVYETHMVRYTSLFCNV